jgi:hypothetical protein
MYEIRTGALPNTSLKRAKVWRSRGIAPLSLNFGTMAVSGQLHVMSALPPPLSSWKWSPVLFVDEALVSLNAGLDVSEKRKAGWSREPMGVQPLAVAVM